MKKLQIGSLVLALLCLVQGPSFAVTDSGAIVQLGDSGGVVATATGDGSLTTMFASDNNFAGNSFDITATVGIEVVGWDINLDTVVPQWTVDVWTRAGTANGYEGVADGWTLLGSEVVVGAGVDQPTHLDIGGLVVTAGETVGVIITAHEAVSGTGGFNYTNGASQTFSNADISVTTFRGLGDGFPPTSIFDDRMWNGTVHYNYLTTPAGDSSWGSLKIAY